jgi:hypothetical protein
MSNLTPELNLAQAVDSDDTADYLTLSAGLAGSLAILDGLFNNTSGHTHSGSHQGGVLGPNAFPDNTFPGARLVDGSVTTPKLANGAVTGPKLASGLLETLYAATWTSQGTNYVVAASILYVFCTAAITVTLPAAATTNRPITVVAITGTTTVASAGGSVIGGSINTSTGAIMNGTCSQGDSLTYKSDSTSWRVV